MSFVANLILFNVNQPNPKPITIPICSLDHCCVSPVYVIQLLRHVVHSSYSVVDCEEVDCEVADRETSDRKTSECGVADRGTSNRKTSDCGVADRKTSDREASDRRVAGRGVVDRGL